MRGSGAWRAEAVVKALPRVPFSTALFSGEPHPQSCPICMEDFEEVVSACRQIVLTPCFHVFHENCLRGWVVRRRECPSCRWDITNLGEKEALAQRVAALAAAPPAGVIDISDDEFVVGEATSPAYVIGGDEDDLGEASEEGGLGVGAAAGGEGDDLGVEGGGLGAPSANGDVLNGDDVGGEGDAVEEGDLEDNYDVGEEADEFLGDTIADIDEETVVGDIGVEESLDDVGVLGGSLGDDGDEETVLGDTEEVHDDAFGGECDD